MKNQVIQDDAGRILGKVESPKELNAHDVRVVKEFLIALKQENHKPKKEEIMSKQEKVNIAWLAGTLKFDPKRYERVSKALIETGQKQAIPVSVLNDESGLSELFLRFRQGDFIKLIAIVEAYGVKQDDGTWKNGMSVRVTEIKTAPPKREQKIPAGYEKDIDDDIPF
jgi:hypothetical protein